MRGGKVAKDPVLTKGLRNLRDQVNEAFPDRDKTTDGWIGDDAHRAHTSGHNPDDTPGSKPAWDGDPDSDPEVRAWDMDADLRDPDVSTQDYIDHLTSLPNLGLVLRYVIFDRKIYHVRTGFQPEPYNEDDPHTNHVHHEGAKTQAGDENDTFDFKLGELMAAPTADENATALIKKVRNTKEFLSDTEVSTITNQAAKATAAALTPALNQLLALAKGEAAEVPPTVEQISAGVLAALGELPSAAEKAKLLAPLLGSDAAEVGRLLAGETSSS